MKQCAFLVGVFALGIVTGAMLFLQMESTQVFTHRFCLPAMPPGVDSGHVVLSISVLLLGFLLFRCITLGCRKESSRPAEIRSKSKGR